jgi:hypothetical protein
MICFRRPSVVGPRVGQRVESELNPWVDWAARTAAVGVVRTALETRFHHASRQSSRHTRFQTDACRRAQEPGAAAPPTAPRPADRLLRRAIAEAATGLQPLCKTPATERHQPPPGRGPDYWFVAPGEPRRGLPLRPARHQRRSQKSPPVAQASWWTRAPVCARGVELRRRLRMVRALRVKAVMRGGAFRVYLVVSVCSRDR